MLQSVVIDQPLELEGGGCLSSFRVAYHTYGKLNATKDNVVWVCHALTASSDAADWWPGLIGPGMAIDTDRYFVVCANILGSCYGSTGPADSNPEDGSHYYDRFPLITIRDMVQAHIHLRRQLGINTIRLLVGGSMGGYQAMEWALMEPAVIGRLFLIATSAAESAWGIAIHTAQRMAISADGSWGTRQEDSGSEGLKAARAIGMLSYRNYELFAAHQQDPDKNKLDHYKASSYMAYQGEKLRKRFNAYAYWTLSKAMDTHNISRGREGDCASVLAGIRQPVLLMGISSDRLCPPAEQEFMAAHLPQVTYRLIDSVYGHDGFLIEVAQITSSLQPWLDTDL